MHFPMTIGVRRSFLLCLGVLLTHALAAFLLFLPGWPLPIPLAAIPLLLCSGWLAWRCGAPAVDAVRLLQNGCIEWRRTGEEEFQASELLPGAMVHPLLTVFHLRCGGKRQVVVILPDSVSREEHRRLRVWLRWRAVCGRQEGAIGSAFG